MAETAFLLSCGMPDLILVSIPPMKLIYYVLLASAFLTALIKLKSLPGKYVVFVVALGAALITQVIDDAVSQQWPFVFHLYHLVEYSCLAYFLHLSFRQKLVRKMFLLSIPGFIIFMALYFLAIPEEWNSFAMSDFVVIALLVSLGTIFFFFELYISKELVTLHRLPDFWIGVANLLFYSGTIMVLGMRSFLPEVSGLIYILYGLNLFLYSCYLIGFLCQSSTTRS